MAVDVKSVISTGRDMHGQPWSQLIYPSYGDYKLPVYIWLASLSAYFFGLSEWSLRLPSAVAGLLTVVLAGAVARQLWLVTAPTTTKNSTWLQRWQLAAMLVVAISPWSVLFSRTGFEGHLGQMWLAGAAYCFLRAVRQASWQRFLLWGGGAAALAAVATYSYYSVRFVWPIVWLAILGLAGWQRLNGSQGHVTGAKSSWRQKLTRLIGQQLGLGLMTVLIFVILLQPLLRSPLAAAADRFRLGTASVLNNAELVHLSNADRLQAGNTLVDRLWFNHELRLSWELLRNYGDHLSPGYLFLTGDPNLRHGTQQFGLFVWPAVLLWLIGGAYLLHRQPGILVLLSLWWLAALLPAAVPENTPHALRSLNALVPLSIWIGVGAAWVASKWPRWQQPLGWWRPAFWLIFVFVTTQFCWYYFTIYPRLAADDWQSGYSALAKELTQAADSAQTTYILPFDDRFYLWLLLYGSYPMRQVQTWPSQDFKLAGPAGLENFAGLSWQVPNRSQLAKLLASGQQLRLAGERLAIEKYCQDHQVISCQVTPLLDEVGQPKLAVATLQWSSGSQPAASTP